MSHCCQAASQHFDEKVAEQDLATYRTQGLDKRAKLLLDALRRAGVSGRSVLDVGAGVGMLGFELLKAGASRARLADASPAYIAAAGREAERAGLRDRIETTLGDFVETADAMSAADILVMDRVVCCYAKWLPLLTAAMTRSRSFIGLTYPRARPDVRLVIGFDNLRRRVKADPFRAFVHPPAAMQATLEGGGWRLVSRSGTFVWRVDVYAREELQGRGKLVPSSAADTSRSSPGRATPGFTPLKWVSEWKIAVSASRRRHASTPHGGDISG